MIKNLLDKAKSVIDDIDKPNISPTSKLGKPFEYDDSYFTVNLDGGPIHSDLLIVTSKIRQGDAIDQAVPLSCKWFVTNSKNEMTEIVGVNGVSYQPCVDDVGNRILAQATPLLEGTYTGMPIFKEAGPLKLDPEIEKKALSRLEEKICELPVKIESIYFDYDCRTISLPCDATITLNRDTKSIAVYCVDQDSKKQKLCSCRYTDRYPTLEIIRKTNTSFELHLGAIEVLKLSAETQTDRDVIAIIVRMFNRANVVVQPVPVKTEIAAENAETATTTTGTGTKNDNLSSPPVQQGSQFEDLMRIEQLTKQLKQVDKEKQNWKEGFDMERANKQKLEVEVRDAKEQLEILKRDNEYMTQQVKTLEQEKEKLAAEKLFFLQETNFYKSQVSELELAVQKLEAEGIKEPAMESMEAENNNFKETISELNKKLAKVELECEQLKTENTGLSSKVASHQAEKEDLESNINSLKKKVQSLVQENGKLTIEKSNSQATPTAGTSSGIWNFPASPLYTKHPSDPEFPGGSGDVREENKGDDVAQMKAKVQNYEAEINQLKDKNTKLNTTLEAMKTTSQGQETPNKAQPQQKRGLFNFVAGVANMVPLPGLPKQNANVAQDVEYLQKLVNTLTETIAEKDLVMENLKTVNKELAKRITEAESKSRDSLGQV